MLNCNSMQEKTPLQTRKELGLAHLNADRIEEGLKIYAMILRDYPEDVESYIVIGDCYLAQGEVQTAAQLYAYAMELSPGNNEIMRRLRLTHVEQDAESKETQPAPELRAIGRLLQRIMGKTTPVTDQDLEKATRLLDVIKQSPRPALAVAEHLSDIETLIPAMLELNIRQARAEGRPDLAQALDGLLGSVRDQLESTPTPGRSAAGPTKASGGLRQKISEARILFLIPSAYQVSSRAMLSIKALTARGHTTIIATEKTDLREHYDVAIAFNPHGDTKIMEYMAACAGAKIPVIVDIDRDYEELPALHPAYQDFNVATTEKMKVFTAALFLANRITTSGAVLAEKLGARGRPVSIIPYGWMERNGLWQKPPARRHTINLGWIGSADEVEDVAMVRRMVLRVLREFPNTLLVIGGDAQVYQLFDRLPESRRLFLPPVQEEDYPYLLGQMDLLMLPMRDTLFNQTRSDRRLMEAGARRIPWVASPMPSYTAWEAGGLIAQSPDDWTIHLRRLVLDPTLRMTLGAAGYRKSETREMVRLGELWQNVIEEVLDRDHIRR